MPHLALADFSTLWSSRVSSTPRVCGGLSFALCWCSAPPFSRFLCSVFSVVRGTRPGLALWLSPAEGAGRRPCE